VSSQAYTPGLKRKESYLVQKTRRLPLLGEVFVKEGQIVSYDEIVAKTDIPGEPHFIPVSSILNVDHDRIERYMVKKEEEPVMAGEPVARSEFFFGLFKKAAVSPVTGKVEHISQATGRVLVREASIPVEVKSYIPGTITKVLPQEGVVIETPASFIQGIFGIGGETHGELVIASKTPADNLGAEQITSADAGKILVGGSLVTSDALQKAVKEGVKGIVVGGIIDMDLISFLGYEVGVAITGQEDIGLTLIITEGFGEMAMSDKTFKLLKRHEGSLACINGATQIRAGVVRPEIIIPHRDSGSTGLMGVDEDTSSLGEGITVGTPIRLIREPYFGTLGTVLSLPVELHRVETGSWVRVLEAELEDERRVIVPRANVEIIEE
jgi:hypothetical protein